MTFNVFYERCDSVLGLQVDSAAAVQFRDLYTACKFRSPLSCAADHALHTKTLLNGDH